MKAADLIKSRLGGNIRESMTVVDRSGSTAPAVPTTPAIHGGSDRYQGIARVRDALSIEVSRLHPDPAQPRQEFDPEALQRLAESMKDRGQLQPIRVRFDEGASQWIIIAGERRWRAATMAGLETLVCIEVRGEMTADDRLQDQLLENCIREDLTPLDQARAFKTLLDHRDWSYRDLAANLHIAPASVARAMSLLDLPEAVQAHVESGELAASVAYEVSRLEDPAEQREVAERVVRENLSRAEVVEVVKAASKPKGRAGAAKGKVKSKLPTARTMRTSVGCKITVEHRKGIDPGMMLAAFEEAARVLRAEMGQDAEAA